MAPLICKLQKDQGKELDPFNQKELKAVTKVWKKLNSFPILAFPYAEKHFMVDTFAYGVLVGCNILQVQLDSAERQIRYWLRSLQNVKQAYDTTQRECIAIVLSVTLLRPYPEATWFIHWTSHDSLRWT